MAEKIKIKPEWDNLTRRSTEAWNAGMSYGKYMGMLYSAQQARMEDKRRADAARRKELEARKNQEDSEKSCYVNKCDYCGKPVEGKRKFCDGRCKYLYNQEKIKERAKRDYARKRELRDDAGRRVCTVCGAQIQGNFRKLYCCDECAREGRNARRQAQREEERSERKKDE